MKYKDIINLKRPPSKYPKMSIKDRAAQFAPFKALTGLDEIILDSERITIEKRELTEDAKEILDLRLKKALDEDLEVSIIYFMPDIRREGGSYNKVSGKIKEIDPIYPPSITLNNDLEILTEDIYSVEI